MHFNSQLFRSLMVAEAFVFGLLPTIASSSFGEEIHLDSVGSRFGFNPIGAGHNFYQAEGFVCWDLPWSWDVGRGWRLDTRLDASAGWIGERGTDAAIGTLGPCLVLTPLDWPVSFDCGLSPTVITRSDFPSKNFGIPFQLTSYAGIHLQLSSKFRLTYRFQHMSNADLNRHNPGLNLNVIGVSYLF